MSKTKHISLFLGIKLQAQSLIPEVKPLCKQIAVSLEAKHIKKDFFWWWYNARVSSLQHKGLDNTEHEAVS